MKALEGGALRITGGACLKRGDDEKGPGQRKGEGGGQSTEISLERGTEVAVTEGGGNFITS